MIVRVHSIWLSAFLGLVASIGSASATPITTLTPLHSNGTEVFAVYIFSDAHDTSNVSEFGPNSISNFFCNHSNGSCTASTIGQTIDLGPTDPGIAFELTDLTVAGSFRTDTLGSDGYAHDLVSATIDASDANAVASAYSIFGQGALQPAAAAAIALLGEVPGTVITFVGWEDRVGLDYDYNDLIFAFTDPICVQAACTSVPEPSTLALFGLGFAALFGATALRRKPS